MGLTDENFRKEYQPLHIPSHYDINSAAQDKVVYVLAQLGEGSAKDVQDALARNEQDIPPGLAAGILMDLFDKGLIKGKERQGQLYFNLSKITHSNEGAIDPQALTPGLD